MAEPGAYCGVGGKEAFGGSWVRATGTGAGCVALPVSFGTLAGGVGSVADDGSSGLVATFSVARQAPCVSMASMTFETPHWRQTAWVTGYSDGANVVQVTSIRGCAGKLIPRTATHSECVEKLDPVRRVPVL